MVDSSMTGTPALLAAYDLVPPVRVFALRHQGVNNGNLGVRTGAGEFVWKTYTSYDSLAAIEYEHCLLKWLAGRKLSFDVPRPLATREGSLLCRGHAGWSSLSRRLPGTPLDSARPDHAKLLGAALGEVQAALRAHPPVPRPGRPLFGTLFAFPPPGRDPFTVTPEGLGLPASPQLDRLFGWWREEAGRLRAFVDGPYRTLAQQVCHNDVTPGNVLVEEGRVGAVLDFEFATPAARALDVAHSLRLVMRVWENPPPWEACHLFCRGYTRWMRLTESELKALPWLIRLRYAITVLWWLGRGVGVDDAAMVPSRIEYMQHFVRWLDGHEQQFVDLLMTEMA